MKHSEHSRYVIIEEGQFILGRADTIKDCRDLIESVENADYEVFGDRKHFKHQVFYCKHDGTLGKEYKRL